jgi:hypothetical protein
MKRMLYSTSSPVELRRASVLGYENDLSRPVIRFWKETRHVDVETELAAHAHS